jgi:hypothetical protein
MAAAGGKINKSVWRENGETAGSASGGVEGGSSGVMARQRASAISNEAQKNAVFSIFFIMAA